MHMMTWVMNSIHSHLEQELVDGLLQKVDFQLLSHNVLINTIFCFVPSVVTQINPTL